MKHLINVYLYLLTGVIMLGILAISAQTSWQDRQHTWREAEISSKNLLTTVSRDIANNLNLVDVSLNGVIEGLRQPALRTLSPDMQHRMLFDRATSASFTGTILLLDANGDLVADGGSIIAPRPLNLAQRDYLDVHKAKPLVGLHLGRPYKSRVANDEMSFSLSRRVFGPEEEFAGVVAAGISLTDLHDLFKSLNLGRGGSISLFRSDGILLMRQPYNESDIGRDLGDTPNVRRFIQAGSGLIEGTAAIDGVHRLYTFERVGNLPLILAVSLSVDDLLAPWWRKAFAMALVTGILCSAVVGLLFFFQRELTRRTSAEAELAKLASTDALTGLSNRRAFDETFEQEWRYAIRSGSTISLLYIDVDFFKMYNDQCGHPMGDELLRAIASVLSTNIGRPRDVAARHGGEEFVVLLSETDQASALLIAETIRRAVMALGVRHDGSSHSITTVSIGVASVEPTSGMVRSTLLKAADAALYRAKAEGRNCVRVSTTTRVSVGSRESVNG